ncbi:hypothetical protein [Anatilimnocola floriformis]|uniref:hypothetical protein n=1 Tax=Anatilimnocola floriformis TaxID=2948575 RepID=UPI0020C3450E|nr:hypothetical protein [Anatilimnocola floriformis]
MNRRTWSSQALLVAGLLAIGGCGSSPPPVATAPPTPAPATVPGPPATIPGPPATIPGPPPAVAPQTPQPATPTDPAAPIALPASPPEPPATPTETVKAQAGVAAAGRTLDQHEGMLVTPAKAYFAVREKVVFQIQIPQAIQLYKAENTLPQTFEEFKQNILDPNKIKLPPLPPGHTYEWNAEEEQLMVKRPKS